MAASVKSKNELEQVALAMMMMAGGEGTSSSATTSVEVGVKTRSSSSRRSSLQQNLNNNNNNRRGRSGEPVSENYLNKNKTKRNHDQPEPGSMEDENEGYDEDNEDPLAPDQSPEEEESATDLVVLKQEEADEAIICAINPLSIQSSPSPSSPAGSLQSTNSGSGGSGAGVSVPGSSNDCIYMSSSRRIFRPEFKQKVLDAFANDPDCVGNQRATARKFGIHRRQVQKWLQQLQSGELSFSKDLQQQKQGDNEDSNSEQTELTSSKLVVQQRSSKGNQLIRNTSGKVISTRRSLGGGSVTIRQSTGNQERRGIVGRGSDPPSRPSRSSVRSKGNKSMPLKGGSKSGSHYVPTIVHPSASSSSSSPLINLSKGGKNQNGGGNSSSTATSSYAYYNNDSNGTNDNSSSSNMFMNMSTLLASAAAAGNLTMPLSLENPRNFSPRDHSPINNNGRSSPTNSAGGSSGGSHNSSLQNALLLVDELNFLYPYSDFSLLRKALLKEEVSLEKLAHPLVRGNKSTEFRVNGNGLNSDLNQGLRELRRAAALSPSPAKSTSSREEYNTQQTLDILRQQQEYLKLLQQCGIGNSSELTSGLNLADLSSNGNNGRLPAWFNPFAAAAAAGLPMPSTSSGKFGSGSSGSLNGNGSESGNRRSNPSKQDGNDNHRFASPRVPPAVNSNKAKTVAAALAATRVQSTSSQQQQIVGGRNFSNHPQTGRHSQNQRNAQRRKAAANARQAQARASHHQMDDDMIDPTSMLEVVTNIPSPSNSPAVRTNQYGYNRNHQRNDGNNDYQQGQGMDLSTTSSSTATSSSNSTTTPSNSTRLISKAMNKEYSFLSELGLIRKSPEKESSVSASTSGKNGYGLTHTASLENFVENILPPRQKSPLASSTSSSSPPASDLSDSEKTKNMVIDAFTYDPEISGDARAVARKFGLNVRVVMKWLKEGPSKSSPQQASEYGPVICDNVQRRVNGGGEIGGVSDEEESSDYIQTQLRNVQSLQKTMLNESNNNSTGTNGGNGGGVNKRKNSKPNQICDFPTEEDGSLNCALDMVVPIKKRRVSSPSPTPQDA